jgi:sugar/nucleoside kinase (ribokinase family)/succinate dehydrogenase/fumarate reductase flavoprotein subunit
VLDSLTDVAMPRLPSEPPVLEFVNTRGVSMPVRTFRALVIGSGAAGLRAAIEIKRRGIDVAVASQSAFGGTSACSGSDKQTLHTANTADQGDDFQALADAIGAGGAMDEDTAYVESVGSARALASLQFLGLPLPQDPLGGVLRYQTDHDDVGRATSCGPRTSRLMVQILAREAIQMGIPIFNHTTAVRILVAEAPMRRVAGVLALVQKHRSDSNPLGALALLCDHLVLAGGGPGELYRDSVYPRHCFGTLGLALDAGIEAVNLTESQFGIGTSRDGFPWNLSGTYAQAMPYVFSIDERGEERNFLADYYRSTRELASNTFRKGYQWPFHAMRMLDFGSSLFDLAVFREMQAGRHVYMDFNRNPQPVGGDANFDLERLDDDVRAYLEKSGALLPTPIERLRKMNPLSIELYKRYKVDITQAPLPFAMNNQHMNGGLAVDVWGCTSLAGCYAVGETAGTHGVTRPGGAALIAGQVFGTRCAEHMASRPFDASTRTAPEDLIGSALDAVGSVLRDESPLHIRELQREIQARMSDHAGIICRAADVQAALEAARRLNAAIAAQGIARDGKAFDAVHALQWRHTALASEAVLTALDFYIGRGGGSRGARAICSPDGDQVPQSRCGPIEDMRFIAELAQDRDEQILVRRHGDRFVARTRALRRRERGRRPFFERDWPNFLTGAIFDTGAQECDAMNSDTQVRSWTHRHVLGIGEAMIEFASTGGDTYRRGFAGDTLNTCWYLAQLLSQPGDALARVGYYTHVGQDVFSEQLLAFIEASHIDASRIVRAPDRSLGLYVINLLGAERHFSYWRDTSAARRLADDRDGLSAATRDIGLIYVSGITLAVIGTTGRRHLLEALRLARQAGTVVAFDPNVRPRLWLDSAEMKPAMQEILEVVDVVLPSFEDEAALWGDEDPQATLSRLEQAGVPEIIVKNGAGDLACSWSGRREVLPTPPIARIIDTTGAGDSFNAGYLAGRLVGMPVAQACRVGQLLAGIVIGHFGALTPADALHDVGLVIQSHVSVA